MERFIPLKVLVVDDAVVNRRLLQAFLEKLGHSVVLAEDGEQGIALFQQEQPDIVLMDVVMPKVNGLDSTRRIKELSGSRWVPVLVVSTLSKPEQLVEGLEAGADDYLPKPLNFRILEAKMRSIERTLSLQTRVRDSLRRTQAITDHMLDSMITIDERGYILSCNPATTRLFGYAEEELLGNNVKMLMPEPVRGNHDGYLAAYAATGQRNIVGANREVEGRRKDGTSFPLQLGVSEVVLDGQRTFIGLLRDISERRESERKIREHAERLQRYHDEAEAENAFAREIMLKQLHRTGLDDPRLHYGVDAAAHFSGDMAAAKRSPQNRLYAMLCDATGHGLAAAISAMPAIPVFYGMASRNLPLSLIVSEMNATLRQAMPAGRFVALVMVCIDESLGVVEIWNGGMPDVLWLDEHGKVSRAFSSRQLPLGIVDSEALDVRPVRFEWPGSGQLAICSDGVLEAENPEGTAFGMERLAAVLAKTPGKRRCKAVQDELRVHMDGLEARDDASIMIIDCLAQQTAKVS